MTAECDSGQDVLHTVPVSGVIGIVFFSSLTRSNISKYNS